jgi:hypothetical protein
MANMSRALYRAQKRGKPIIDDWNNVLLVINKVSL